MSSTIISNITQIRVRYADTDKMQFVYNGMYLTYCEVGRTELLRACGLPYSELERQGFMMPVLEAHIFYKSPAFYDDVLDVKASFDTIPKATLSIEYEFKRGPDIIATGWTMHSFMKAETKKAIRPPTIFIDSVKKFKENLMNQELL